MLGFPFVPRSFCEFVCDRQKQTTKKNKKKTNDREVKRNLLLSCLIYLFLHWTHILITPSARSPGSTARYHSGGQTILYSLRSTKGSFKGSLGGSGSLLGAPSQCFSDETESACRSPESSPPAVARKCFLKCSYNIFVTEAPHTQTITIPLTHPNPLLTGNLLTFHQESRWNWRRGVKLDDCTAAPQSISRRNSSLCLN